MGLRVSFSFLIFITEFATLAASPESIVTRAIASAILEGKGFKPHVQACMQELQSLAYDRSIHAFNVTKKERTPLNLKVLGGTKVKELATSPKPAHYYEFDAVIEYRYFIPLESIQIAHVNRLKLSGTTPHWGDERQAIGLSDEVILRNYGILKVEPFAGLGIAESGGDDWRTDVHKYFGDSFNLVDRLKVLMTFYQKIIPEIKIESIEVIEASPASNSRKIIIHLKDPQYSERFSNIMGVRFGDFLGDDVFVR